jgi:hypothetical protein
MKREFYRRDMAGESHFLPTLLGLPSAYRSLQAVPSGALEGVFILGMQIVDPRLHVE